MLKRMGCLVCVLCGVGAPAADAEASVVAVGYKLSTPAFVAPGQIITFFVHGIGAGLTAPVRAAGTPLPMSLAGISAMLLQYNPALPVPILAVEPIPTCGDRIQSGCGTYTAITVQIPFEMQAWGPGVITGQPPLGAQIVLSENGAVVTTFALIPVIDQIHLVPSCDVLFVRRDLTCSSIAAHADGSLITVDSPAKAGEEIVLYGLGLGYTNPPVKTSEAPGSATPTATSFSISFDPRQNALAARPPVGSAATPLSATPLFVGLTTNYAGLYQINVRVPQLPVGSLPCSLGGSSGFNGIRIASNLTINIGGPVSFDGVGICVEPVS
jgi:uncharacterized protein (TIGR03437 family)